MFFIPFKNNLYIFFVTWFVYGHVPFIISMGINNSARPPSCPHMTRFRTIHPRSTHRLSRTRTRYRPRILQTRVEYFCKQRRRTGVFIPSRILRSHSSTKKKLKKYHEKQTNSYTCGTVHSFSGIIRFLHGLLNCTLS